MPIAPSLRKYYGAEWRRYRDVLLDLASHQCQKCGSGHPMLNCAHVHHDPRNNALVAVWCPGCHSRHDAGHRLAVMRRNRAKRVGQLWLWEEVKWAPYPLWVVPRRVVTEGQMDFGFACGGVLQAALPQR
jgi:hypothetical protein